MTALMLIAQLMRAEDILRIELMLAVYSDGSGRVVEAGLYEDRPERLIYSFDRIGELNAWLEAPRVCVYDEYGEIEEALKPGRRVRR